MEEFKEIEIIIDEIIEQTKETDMVTGKMLIKILNDVKESYQSAWEVYTKKSRLTYNARILKYNALGK